MRVQCACHNTLPWLTSFLLDEALAAENTAATRSDHSLRGWRHPRHTCRLWLDTGLDMRTDGRSRLVMKRGPLHVEQASQPELFWVYIIGLFVGFLWLFYICCAEIVYAMLWYKPQ
jgi:hypothetical protein